MPNVDIELDCRVKVSPEGVEIDLGPLFQPIRHTRDDLVDRARCDYPELTEDVLEAGVDRFLAKGRR